MAGLWEKAKYWLDRVSSHGVGVGSVSAVCPRAGGLSRRRRDEIIVVVVVVDRGCGLVYCLISYDVVVFSCSCCC